MSRRMLLAFKFAVSALLIAVIFRNIDLDSLAERFAGQSRVWLIAAAIVTIAQILLAALRWDQIIKGMGARVPMEAVLRERWGSAPRDRPAGDDGQRGLALAHIR